MVAAQCQIDMAVSGDNECTYLLTQWASGWEVKEEDKGVLLCP